MLSIRQEREKAVVQLYREGRSYREISRIARISVRDIKPILQKYGADNYLSNDQEIDTYFNNEDIRLPNSTKAYKLFAEEKSPSQVSIELNLRAPEVKTILVSF